MLTHLKTLGCLAALGLLVGCTETNIMQPQDDTTYIAPDSTTRPVDRDVTNTRENITVLKPVPVEPVEPEENPANAGDPNITEPGNTGNEEGYKAPRAGDEPQVQPDLNVLPNTVKPDKPVDD